MNQKVELILVEIKSVLNRIDDQQLNSLIQDILLAEKIVVLGAGRVGLVCKAFGMRLSHLGLRAFTIGDSNVPPLGEMDLLIVASGSGETDSIFDLVNIASNNGCKIDVITSNSASRIARAGNIIVKIPAPSKIGRRDDYISEQPMTTLFEQCLSLFFDSAVLFLMDKMGETNTKMWTRHTNLE